MSRELDPVLAVAGLPCDRALSPINAEIRSVATGAPADGEYFAVRTGDGLTLLRERPAERRNPISRSVRAE
jgi:hypothetical protein